MIAESVVEDLSAARWSRSVATRVQPTDPPHTARLAPWLTRRSATSSTASSSTRRRGETYDVVDPTTGEVYATAPMSGAEDVDRAYAAAARAFEAWGETTPQERQQALLKIADALEARVEEFIAVECRRTPASRSA